MESIIERIVGYSRIEPDKIALSDGKKEISYEKLVKGILYAKLIIETKYILSKGDLVIIAADKQLEFVSIYFACQLAGVVAVPVAPDINEKRYYLIKNKIHPALVIGFQDADVLTAELLDFNGYISIVDYESITYPSLDDIVNIMFTTGTTGEPKGVLLSQRNIVAAAWNINTFIQNTSDDVEMIALPISHSFGLGRMRCALLNGQTVVMLGSFVNVKRFFRFIEKYKVTGFGMVPSSWALLKKLSGMKISEYKDQLHYIEIGSAPMPIEEKQELMKALPGTRICMHYGLTEASRSAFMEFHESPDRLMTIGRQSPNMHIVIKDESGKDVLTGQDGEICVSGDAVMVGYRNLPKEEYFYGNYFRTGDWGYMDEDGFITLRSRKKELINVGGKKVSPMEVEAVLMAFDFVEDCACIAAMDPDGILGEVVKAYIVTDQPEKVKKDIIDKLIGNQLEGYKHPAEYAVIDKIPKTKSGKVQRLLLK